MRFPVFLTALIMLAASIAVVQILSMSFEVMPMPTRVQSITGIAATAGALISALFIIGTYRQSVQAFVESNRPQLLVQLANAHEDSDNSPTPIPRTHIHYRNPTSNQFNDLSFIIYVSAFGEKFDLSDLFRTHMTMPGHDARQKWFRPVEYLKQKGLYLNTEIEGRSPPKLTIEYE